MTQSKICAKIAKIEFSSKFTPHSQKTDDANMSIQNQHSEAE
ncbi:hypothetical protein [Porphyromonas sp.]|nr:hypothetical protein [Porphyromonas sp.]MDO4771606.1 hypothetical protein [Porphyromonas sp.]